MSFFAANSIERVGETVKHYVTQTGEQVTTKEVTVEDVSSNDPNVPQI